MKTKQQLAFLVFSDDWGEHPSSCQHIFKHIVKEHKVLWVNTIGMRNPKLSITDFGKVFYKIRKMIFGTGSSIEQSLHPPNLKVCQPLMLPYANFLLVRKLNKYLVVRSVQSKMAEFKMGKAIFVTTVPNACDFVGKFGAKKNVYYCVDDFTEWPGMEHDLVRLMEMKLIEKTDCFIATSQKLYEKLLPYGKPIKLLSHGVDVELFRNMEIEEHSLLKNIPKPRVGYYGLFDERSDQRLLADLAARLPDVSIVITGRVETDVSLLIEAPNIYFTGAVPYHDLPSIVAGWEACILPYKRNKLTESISPLKLKEYIATGKPIIASPIQELSQYAEYLDLCESTQAWVRIIKRILTSQLFSNKNERKESIEQESWEIKANFFLDFILIAKRASSW